MDELAELKKRVEVLEELAKLVACGANYTLETTPKGCLKVGVRPYKSVGKAFNEYFNG